MITYRCDCCDETYDEETENCTVEIIVGEDINEANHIDLCPKCHTKLGKRMSRILGLLREQLRGWVTTKRIP